MLIYYYCVSAWPGPASSQRHGDDQTLPGQDAAGLLAPQEAGKPPVCHLHHLLLCEGNAGLSTLFFCLFLIQIQIQIQKDSRLFFWSFFIQIQIQRLYYP